MKKTLSVVILSVLALSLLLYGCSDSTNNASSTTAREESSVTSSEIYVSSDPAEQNKNNSSQNKAPTQSQKPSQKPQTTVSRQEEVDYQDVECREITKFNLLSFAADSAQPGRKIVFKFAVPEDWQIQKSGGSLKIYRGSKQIGSITTYANAPKQNEANNVFSGEMDEGNYTIYNDIYHKSGAEFTRVLGFCDKSDKGICLTYNYEELSGEFVMKIMGEVEMSISSVGAAPGSLAINDSRGKILLLGNSFISSSKIGITLREMCAGKIEVDSVSRGMAHVGTFTEDTALMSRIKNGEFSAVFMCGLYSQTALNHFEDMYKACKLSDTRLVIFPAHNENRKIVTSACLKYPDVDILDWKGEIDEHIRSGIDYFTFCADDSYDHSKPIAGYVGAHMIYRSIFGQMPKTAQYSEVTSAEIAILGSYPQTGKVEFKKASETYQLS